MAAGGVLTWSQTAATNATADSTVNYAEGQAPSSLNDSARAAMASVAKYRDDIAGSIVTGGSSTAYTVTSSQGFALTAGYMIAFSPHVTSGATVTLNVDSLGAKPLRSAPGVELPSGVLVQGTPYVATYYTSNSGEWILQGFYGNPYNIPIGGIMPYLGSTAPNSSFVLPYGQAVSRTTYSTLFSLVSTTFGTGDGSTTFNLPDLRGRVIPGLDNMGGSAASRITVAGGNFDGTSLGATGGAQNTTLITANLPAYTPAGTIGNVVSGGTLGGTSINDVTLSDTHQIGLNPQAIVVTSTFTGTAQGGTSTAFSNLPPSMALPYILRII